MKKIFFIITLLISSNLIAQQSTKLNSLKEISGFITHTGTPLTDVNIVVKNTTRGTKTNKKGFYKIKANVGEIIVFSYVGMKVIKIVVEDVTTVLNISMKIGENELDEVTITAKKEEKSSYSKIKKPKLLQTGRGIINTRSAGYGTSYVKGEDLSLASGSLAQALIGKIGHFRLVTDDNGDEFITFRGATSFVQSTAAIWEVDGIIYKVAPTIDFNNIEDITVIKSYIGTNNYGSEGRGGVIVVRTKTGALRKARDVYSKSNPYTNKEYYSDDAQSINKLTSRQAQYLDVFDTISNTSKAFEAYQNMVEKNKHKIDFHLNVSNYFKNVYNDAIHSEAILSDLEVFAAANPEILKTIAYTYQKRHLHKKAINVYKKVIKLRPKHAQSFRDLANAYVHDKNYPSAWKVYMNYLYKGNKLEENGIGEIMYREMEALYTQKKEAAKIRESFKLKEENIDRTVDVRMVFEWNTSEAEFVLEFVNPQKQSYSIEHSLDKSEDLILDEKLNGYSSKEFVIDKLGTGDWLVNVNYLGNKTYAPTYLKVTVYHNWERSNQTEEIHLFKLTRKNVKIQLLKLNANSSTYTK